MPPIPPDQQSPYGGDPNTTRFLTGPQVAARYGVTPMSIWRWLRDSHLGFPPPAMHINRLRYWREEDLIAWERRSAPARHRARA
jgi:predicted DNA-binding transcriptional regulator AlpA